MSSLSLEKTKPSTDLVESFKANGFIKVKQALTQETAQLIYQQIAEQPLWNLVFDANGKHQDLNSQEVAKWSEQQKDDLQRIIYQQAQSGFQYHYETIPLYDIYQNNLMPGHFFNQIIEFINQESSLDFFRELLSAPDIAFADGQITRFSAGHFLNVHNDDVENKNRIAAYVINLTPEWQANWGGALHLLDDNGAIKQSFLPTFNEINIFKIPVDHYVGYVSPFATKPRLSITGWLRRQ
ncbi:2OG-Fe(II) oxygenase [Thalassotalea sp. LPB0316]|uniref:2OG-Fe(II) oxygenase n=1 Tax=Thalassotalea sp. LPB0316 TaxID=2769490 RepID=UPI001866E01A|nr:2OG-Fe(II) oxygenase family protein [Thalassotalea sp. LPB0316]QOL27158.1 2OG-Fe(II) oxygenase [Thalassotalea sp. LPB0316]